MKLIVVIIMFLYGHCLFAQHAFPMKGYKGVLFADTVRLDFSIDSASRRFTPSRDEVFLTDKIVIESKETFVKSWGQSFKRELKKSNRQFVGYYDLNGDKHIVVFLLNMKGASSKKHFEEWLIKPVVGFGDFYERNLKMLDVNLNRKRAKIY